MATNLSDLRCGLFSAAPKNSREKLAWGSIKNIPYEVLPNKTGETFEYFLATNESDDNTAFKIEEMNVSIWELNDFTQEISRLASTNKLRLLGKYLSLVVKSEGFRFHTPDYTISDEELKLLGGSREELNSFLELSKRCAMRSSSKS